MPAVNNNPLTYGQIEADLFVARATIDKAKGLSSKAGKYYRGQAGYHLQQAAEKLIKIQIYNSGVPINHAKLYRHSLDDLITYAMSIGIEISIPIADAADMIVAGYAYFWKKDAVEVFDLNDLDKKAIIQNNRVVYSLMSVVVDDIILSYYLRNIEMLEESAKMTKEYNRDGS